MALGIGKKLLSLLNSLFNSIGSPIPGYDVDDVQAKKKGDNFSSLFQFSNLDTEGNVQELKDERTGEAITDIQGNKLEIAVLLSTLNAKEVIGSLYDAMNDLGLDDAEFGEKYGVGGKSDFYGLMDNILKSDFKGFNYDQELGAFDNKMWSWADIRDALTFALECTSPGRDYGAIEGKGIDVCGKLISEYLIKVGLIKSESEVKVDPKTLVIPILTSMQQDLAGYFEEAKAKYTDQDNSTDSVSGDELDEAQQADDAADQIDNAFGDNDIDNAKHIDVTLRKITATSELEMTMIKANYSPSLVLTDMEEILDQPEFMEALPEELTSYSIDVDNDGFDIEPCEECIECNPCESLCEVFKAGIRAYRNLYILHWMSHGNDMMKLHNLSEEMYNELQGEIDTIGELLVEKQGTVPQLDFPCDYIPVQQYDFQTGLDQIKSLIQMYIDCIDYAYCNQDSDVQSTLDEWLRYWNKQLNYFVKGQEV